MDSDKLNLYLCNCRYFQFQVAYLSKPQLQKVLPEQISFTRSFWFIVHEDYANLERVRVVSDAIIEGIRKEILNKKLMHERHVAVQNAHCFNCHEPMEHKKVTDFIDAGSQNCDACHPEHHKYQKMLLLGKERGDVPETPGLMFYVKTNCMACHREEKIVKGEEVIHGSGKACAACHTDKHEGMAKEWKDKTKEEMQGALEVEKEALEASRDLACTPRVIRYKIQHLGIDPARYGRRA